MGTNPLLLPVCLAFVALFASGAQSEPFRLDDLRWKQRVLLVFAPDDSHPHFKQQLQRWQRAEDGMKERDLVWVPLVAGKPTTVLGMDLGSDVQRSLRIRYRANANSFTVVLLGRDGGEKLHRTEPVEAIDLFRLIDSMPMRQQEMRKQQRDSRSAGERDHAP